MPSFWVFSLINPFPFFNWNEAVPKSCVKQQLATGQPRHRSFGHCFYHVRVKRGHTYVFSRMAPLIWSSRRSFSLPRRAQRAEDARGRAGGTRPYLGGVDAEGRSDPGVQLAGAAEAFHAARGAAVRQLRVELQPRRAGRRRRGRRGGRGRGRRLALHQLEGLLGLVLLLAPQPQRHLPRRPRAPAAAAARAGLCPRRGTAPALRPSRPPGTAPPRPGPALVQPWPQRARPSPGLAPAAEDAECWARSAPTAAPALTLSRAARGPSALPCL